MEYVTMIFVAGGVLLLLFPIYIVTDGYLVASVGKFFFSVQLYGKIVTFSGYATLEREGVAIHKNNTEADWVPFKTSESEKRKEKVLQLFLKRSLLPLKLQNTFFLGWKEHYPEVISMTGMTRAVLAGVHYPLKSKFPQMILRNNFVLYEKEDRFRIMTHHLFVTNLLKLIIVLFRSIAEVIIQSCQLKKKNIRTLKI